MEKRGLFSKINDALFTSSETTDEETVEEEPEEKPRKKTKAVKSVEVAAPSGTDSALVEKTRTALLAKFKETDANAGTFLKTYAPLVKRMSAADAIAAALDVLKEDSINALQVKIGIAQGKDHLEQINKEAEDRYQQTMQDLQAKRKEIEETFHEQRETLEQRIADLSRQVAEAQQQLTALPGQESEEISKSAPDIQKAMVAHESFSAAYRAVLADIQTIDSLIVTEGESK